MNLHREVRSYWATRSSCSHSVALLLMLTPDFPCVVACYCLGVYLMVVSISLPIIFIFSVDSPDFTQSSSPT